MDGVIETGSGHLRALRPAASVLATVACVVLTACAASAQSLDVPVTAIPDTQAAGCASSTVSGLDPSGDNFLAVRSGPGSQYRKLDELHTGDVVRTCDRQGDWIGIYYPNLNGRSGWVHGSYLTDLAG